MAARTVPRAEWRTFFDRLSGAVLGKRAEVEAASLELGDQVVADWVPLMGITYDSRDDAIEVALAGLSHRIGHPRDVHVQEGPHGVETIAVLSEDGVKQVVRLKDPLMLEAGTAGAK